MRPLAMILGFIVGIAPVALSAERLPTPEAVVNAEERSLLPDLRQIFTQGGGAQSAVTGLDSLLDRLNQPTPFRGLVQFFRAFALLGSERPQEARDAIIESVRLLPEHSGPLIMAAQIHTATDEPQISADYLLRASHLDPEQIKMMDGYMFQYLFSQLDALDDDKRIMAVSERLLDIGWAKGSLTQISGMAMEVLESRMERGDVAGAAKMVPKVVTPASFARLLREKRFDPLRPTVEAWAGERLEKQWPIYLTQARAEWEAGRDQEAARVYSGALASAGHDKTLIATFLPLFDSPIDPFADVELVFIVPTLTSALGREGRWDDAYALFTKALAVWPVGSSANAINITGNRARLRLRQGDFNKAVAEFDAVLKDATEWGGQVTGPTIMSMHQYRACALHQLGRGQEDVTSSALVSAWKEKRPTALAYLQICQDDLDSARQTLLDGLESEDTRGDVIAILQPDDDRVSDSDFSRTMAARWERLKADKTLIAAIQPYGRIRSEPTNASAPPENLPNF